MKQMTPDVQQIYEAVTLLVSTTMLTNATVMSNLFSSDKTSKEVMDTKCKLMGPLAFLNKGTKELAEVANELKRMQENETDNPTS